MPVIAGTYQIIGQIGAGGGGIVFLAEHLRLGKKVVLKADRRTLAADIDVLRREVDALKNLNHTYIPQVYDFFEDKDTGTVYTVMSYIDGESFDKPLKRGERFSQPQVIEWACQLLEALSYLHSRPPHGILHADIKPANIMLTPRGEIYLIDFNIALALGEEGAVVVGRSFGYASPEHYGLDYTDMSKRVIPQKKRKDATERIEPPASEQGPSSSGSGTAKGHSGSGSGTASGKTVLLNVRSDIYSLGATLYHIMTGVRPAGNATEVVPISTKEFSPAVIAIINKAMDPNQEQRFQTAVEMLGAFTHLRERDPRTKGYKRTLAATAAMLSCLFLAGGLITFVGLKQMEQLQNAYVLAEYSGNAMEAGDVDAAIGYAMQALPDQRGIFTPPDTAEAQKALADALHVYDLSDGYKAHQAVVLPSAPLGMEIAPDGNRAAAVYANEMAVFDTDTAAILCTLPMERSALAEVKFVDNNRILYAGAKGITAYDIQTGSELWFGRPATAIRLSGDKTRAAAVYKDEGLALIYDVATGAVAREVSFDGKRQRVAANDSFANPHDNLLALNHDGTLLGASFADGSLWVYDLENSEETLELFDGTSGYTHFEGGFFESYFAFSAGNASGSTFAVVDTVAAAQTGGFESESHFGVQTDEGGIYVQTDNLLVKIHPATGEQTALVTTPERLFSFARSATHTLVSSEKGLMFFDKQANLTTRYGKDGESGTDYGGDLVQIAEGTALVSGLDTPVIRIMKYEGHAEAEVFAYDPSYGHEEARISADGKTVMLFSFDQFRLYDIGGDMVAEGQVPDADQLYDQQFRRDEQGSRLEMIYNDGTVRAYSAVDGTLLYETVMEKPDLSLYEEFFTDQLRIESPLHGVPTAYDRDSGKLIRELEKDDYLTYVTQVGEWIITQYMAADGEHYGLLLNRKCETLAYLPYLCDVVGDRLVFDYPRGNLRESRIYNLNELKGLARNE